MTGSRRLRALCDDTGTLLMIDETHTLSAGPAAPRGGSAADIVTWARPSPAHPDRAFACGHLAARVLALVDDEQADIEDVVDRWTLAGTPCDGGARAAWARC